MDQRRGYGKGTNRPQKTNSNWKASPNQHAGCGLGHRPGSLLNEMTAHLPYAILSVALSLSLMSLITFYSLITNTSISSGADVLFHVFHYMHIIFSASGTLIMCLRRNANLLLGLIIASFSSIIFCTLSDSLIPVLGSRMLGVSMHWCLCIANETTNVAIFLLVGLINGYALYASASDRKSSSLLTHFVHVFVSSLASSFYLIAHGFANWYRYIGWVYLFLIIAVVLPCTMSDVIIPLLFTRTRRRNAQ